MFTAFPEIKRLEIEQRRALFAPCSQIDPNNHCLVERVPQVQILLNRLYLELAKNNIINIPDDQIHEQHPAYKYY